MKTRIQSASYILQLKRKEEDQCAINIVNKVVDRNKSTKIKQYTITKHETLAELINLQTPHSLPHSLCAMSIIEEVKEMRRNRPGTKAPALCLNLSLERSPIAESFILMKG